MDKIPYEVGAHYIFDRCYNDFENLYTINRIEAFFVVRAKTNVRFKISSWKRRLPENIISDVTGTFTVYKSSRDYPEELRKVIAIDQILGISLTDKTHIRYFFDKSNFKNVNVLYGSSESNLFNF